jgi:hypothetical protein
VLEDLARVDEVEGAALELTEIGGDVDAKAEVRAVVVQLLRASDHLGGDVHADRLAEAAGERAREAPHIASEVDGSLVAGRAPELLRLGQDGVDLALARREELVQLSAAALLGIVAEDGPEGVLLGELVPLAAQPLDLLGHR